MIQNNSLKKLGFLLLICFFLNTVGYGQKLTSADSLNIKEFTEYVRNGNIEELAKLFAYPIRRDNPLPSIKDEDEFILRYSEIFDSSFVSSITAQGSIDQWSAVGWRGIMFNNGDIWFNYAPDSTMRSSYDWHLVLGLNYHSVLEKRRIRKLIELDNQQLYESLREFYNPVLIIETERFKVRIDKMNNWSYRYASWSIEKDMSEEPDIIVNDGKRVSDGSGGNHHYRFDNGNYTYVCFINVLVGELETPEAELAVFKDIGPEKYAMFDSNPILSEPAKIVRN